MSEPAATIVVVPHERFSYARASLESICAHTSGLGARPPVPLVYVDGGSPRAIRRYLERQARERGFRLIRTDHHLLPNEARALGLAEVRTEYVAFVENDVLVRPGWLDALVRCAEETGAAMVCPLYLEGEPGAEIVHTAGGAARITDTEGGRAFVETHPHYGACPAEIAPSLRREPSELVESHCFLVRRSMLDRLGPLDQRLTAQAHVDLGLAIRAAGESIYFEPGAIVTYVPPRYLAWSDYPYFLLRWSERWNAGTVQHFQRKWALRDDDAGIEALDHWLRERRGQCFDPFRPALRAAVGWRRAAALEAFVSTAVADYLENRRVAQAPSGSR